MPLHNIINGKELKKRIMDDPTPRTTLSFYRYVILDAADELRNVLYAGFEKLGVLGRIYIAYEGINAQLSVPAENFEAFRNWLYSFKQFENVPFKIAVEDDGKSFHKLIVRVRKKIVADGLDDGAFDVTNVGKHLTAEQFNNAMDEPGTIVVDMRNHYESEIGRFENAITPLADTFREELPMVVDLLKEKKDNKVLLYCTGGIRCEKASAYLKHHGFSDVNQLHGGVIEYAREIKRKKLPSKFKGKNFVFDSRMAERITEDVLSVCHQCGEPCDTHTNCANDDCHLLFIQCEKCATNFKGCCTPECKEIASLPLEQQREMRKGKIKTQAHAVYKSRLRPNLRELILKGELKMQS
jgi:UPF0176 protein